MVTNANGLELFANFACIYPVHIVEHWGFTLGEYGKPKMLEQLSARKVLLSQ